MAILETSDEPVFVHVISATHSKTTDKARNPRKCLQSLRLCALVEINYQRHEFGKFDHGRGASKEISLASQAGWGLNETKMLLVCCMPHP
jgi:hypothetical protein